MGKRRLRDAHTSRYAVNVLHNRPAHELIQAIDDFFADRSLDDTLLFYFAGHGIRDVGGPLYLMAADSLTSRLPSTSVPAAFVREQMDHSRSRRIVLLLDCCYAGAFPAGLDPRSDVSDVRLDIERRFGGSGSAVLTASSALEYAFEPAGERLRDLGNAAASLFTGALLQGLRTGEADLDRDGLIGVGELYDYVDQRVRAAVPQQRPQKIIRLEGELYIARSARGPDAMRALPRHVRDAVASPIDDVRLTMVSVLASMAAGSTPEAIAARRVLEVLSGDDSSRVAEAARAAIRPTEATIVPTPGAAAPTHRPILPESQTVAPPAIPKISAPLSGPADPVRKDALAERPPAAASVLSTPPALVSGITSRVRDGGYASLAALLAIVYSFLLVGALIPTNSVGYNSLRSPSYVVFTLLLAALALGAAIGSVTGRSGRLLAPPFLLGLAAGNIGPLGQYVRTIIGMFHYGDGYWSIDAWLGLVGETSLIVAAFFAGLHSMRAGIIRPVPRLHLNPLLWFVALLGLAAAVSRVVLATQFAAEVTAISSGYDAQVVINYETTLGCEAAIALLLSGMVVLAAHPASGVALLAGWTGANTAVAVVPWIVEVQGRDFPRGPDVVHDAAVVALLLLLIPLARAARHGPSIQ